MRRLAIVALLLACASVTYAAEPVLSHGRFESVRLSVPTRVPQHFVMLLAPAADPQAQVIANTLAARGALVARADTKALFKNLEQDGGDCVAPDGDLENLSRFVQASQHLTTYHTPILVGVDEGAAFVYAVLARAEPGAFAGGVSAGFCPQLALRKPLCKERALRYSLKGGRAQLEPVALDKPWSLIDSGASCAAATRQLAAKSTAIRQATSNAAQPRPTAISNAYEEIAKTVRPAAPPPPEQVADLPLVAVPSAKAGDTFAIMLSGDGGWAGLDKEVAQRVAAHGIPVVGFDSLRYFWSERTPQGLARDLERIVRTYSQRWHRNRVVLIGYSQGADVLPFALNELDPAMRQMLDSVVFIGLAERAQFEFHVGNWLGLDDEEEGLPIAPAIRKVRGAQLVCIYGEDDDEAQCERYASAHLKAVKLPGGHHFDGDYEGLADVIVREVR